MKTDVWTVELVQHTIKGLHVRTMETDVLTIKLCTSCLIKDSVRTGTYIIWTVVAVFPYLCFGKKSFDLLNTERRPAMLLRRPNGCNLEQFEASRHKGRFGQKVLIIRMDDGLTVERPDGCKGFDFSNFESMQNLLEV